MEQRKFYWCGFCHRVADKDRNGGFRGKFVDNLWTIFEKCELSTKIHIII